MTQVSQEEEEQELTMGPSQQVMKMVKLQVQSCSCQKEYCWNFQVSILGQQPQIHSYFQVSILGLWEWQIAVDHFECGDLLSFSSEKQQSLMHQPLQQQEHIQSQQP